MIISIISKLGPEYSVFVSTFHATRIVISDWKIPYLSTLFDSLTKKQDNLINMGSLISSNWKDHTLIVQGSKNARSKEKNPKSEIEDEGSKPTDEDSMKKVKKKGSTSKFYYCRKGFHLEIKCFNENMDIMSQLLEKHNIEVLDELEKPADSSKQCHSA